MDCLMLMEAMVHMKCGCEGWSPYLYLSRISLSSVLHMWPACLSYSRAFYPLGAAAKLVCSGLSKTKLLITGTKELRKSKLIYIIKVIKIAVAGHEVVKSTSEQLLGT